MNNFGCKYLFCFSVDEFKASCEATLAQELSFDVLADSDRAIGLLKLFFYYSGSELLILIIIHGIRDKSRLKIQLLREFKFLNWFEGFWGFGVLG